MILRRRKFNNFWKVLLVNIFLILLCLSNVYSTWNLEWLQSQIPFKSNDQSINNIKKLSFPEVSGRIKAFVDFNGDKFTDIVVFNEQEKKIKVLLWNNTEGEFYNGPMVNFEDELVSLITADWTGDGKIDIMSTFYIEQKSHNSQYNKIGLVLFSYNPEILELEMVWSSRDSEFSVVDPLVIDINGDGMLDLLGESDQRKRFIWVNENIDPNFQRSSNNGNSLSGVTFKIYEWGSEISQWVDLESSNFSYGHLVENHSSAFVDMDGDCRSDLVLEVYYEDFDGEYNSPGLSVRKGLEIWTNEIIGDVSVFRRYFHHHKKNNKLGLTLLPIGALSISYSDFNRDGTTDLIVPVCQLGSFGCESKSRIVFIPNIHEYKDCTSTNQFGFSIYKNNLKESNSEFSIKCRSPSLYCTASPFNIHSFTDEDNQLIFQEFEPYYSNKNVVGFFSSIFGGKKAGSHSMGSLFNDFTVSVISDNINDDHSSKKVDGQSTIDAGAESFQKNILANQFASFFSFFPNNKSVKESTMQWAVNRNNQIEINIGDFNLDGYPDILAILKFGNGTRQTKLIENLPIERAMVVNKTGELIDKLDFDTSNNTNSSNSNILSLKKNKLYERMLRIVNSTFQWLSRFVTSSDVIQNRDPLYRRFAVSSSVSTFTNFSIDYAAFYDFFEDGNLDIFSVSYPEKNGKSKVSSKIASLDNPNLFVKVSVLNFPAASKLHTGDSKKVAGTTFFGATVKIRMTGLVGDDIIMTATQMSHSTGKVLQTPFVLFGLGKTNNYIEELYVGTNYVNRKLLSGSNSILEYKQLFRDGVSKWNNGNAQFTYTNIWTGLIPNTQIIAQLNPIDNPHYWTLVLSVSPQKTIKGVLIVCTLALLIIGVIIIVLDRKEKAEDMKEHQGFKSNFISA